MNRGERRAQKSRARKLNLFVGKVIVWRHEGMVYSRKIEDVCPHCNIPAIVELPDPMKAEQEDGTTHVCLPVIGGCNHGFLKESKAT